jgi:hypothetical protein
MVALNSFDMIVLLEIAGDDLTAPRGERHSTNPEKRPSMERDPAIAGRIPGRIEFNDDTGKRRTGRHSKRGAAQRASPHSGRGARADQIRKTWWAMTRSGTGRSWFRGDTRVGETIRTKARSSGSRSSGWVAGSDGVNFSVAGGRTGIPTTGVQQPARTEGPTGTRARLWQQPPVGEDGGRFTDEASAFVNGLQHAHSSLSSAAAFPFRQHWLK